MTMWCTCRRLNWFIYLLIQLIICLLWVRPLSSLEVGEVVLTTFLLCVGNMFFLKFCDLLFYELFLVPDNPYVVLAICGFTLINIINSSCSLFKYAGSCTSAKSEGFTCWGQVRHCGQGQSISLSIRQLFFFCFLLLKPWMWNENFSYPLEHDCFSSFLLIFSFYFFCCMHLQLGL